MIKNITAVIQARMGSSRLPGKVLMEVLGKSILFHVAERLKRVESIRQIIIATSDQPQDDRIEAFCAKNGFPVFRGSENDVLDRFYHAAKTGDADAIIRVTADCPLIDPGLVQKLIVVFKKTGSDYCSIGTGAPASGKNDFNRYPDGLDAEIFRMEALESAWINAIEPSHREHVTPYIWRNSDKFKIGIMECDTGDFSEYRWTLDNLEDFQLIKWIYEELYDKNPSFEMQDVLNLLYLNPSMMQMNRHLLGKEGYDQFWH